MWRSVVMVVFCLAAPVAAKATEVSLSYGATVATEYVSNGLRYSEGVVFQPYVELAYGGLYAGAYASNVDENLTGADIEYGLSLGYRGEAGRWSYDIGMAYYIYNEAFPGFPVEDSAEAIASLTYAATDAIYLTAKAAIAPEYDQTNLSLTVDYYTAVEGLAVGATIGRLEANYGAWNYWSAGASYQVADAVGVSLFYHDSDVDPALGLANSDGLFVASVSFDF